MALVGGLLAAVGILVIAYHHRLGLTPVRMVLAGVILSTGISALTLLITSKIDTEKYRFVTMWQAGSIWGSNWFFVGALLPWLVIGFFFAMKRHRLLDIFQLGDETAISVGIAVKKERIVSLLLAVMLAASAISVYLRHILLANVVLRNKNRYCHWRRCLGVYFYWLVIRLVGYCLAMEKCLQGLLLRSSVRLIFFIC